jgi:hypothetical protein
MSWLSSLGNDIANVWNDQPNWLKGGEIATAATLATAGIADVAAPLFAGAGALTGGATAAADTGFDLSTIGAGVTDTGTALTGADAAGDATALGFAGDAAAGGAGTGIDAINTALGIGTGGTDASSALALTAPDAVSAPLGTTAGAAAGSAPLSLSADAGYDLSTLGPGVSSTGGAVTGAGSGGGSSFLSSLLTGAENSVTKNPLGIALAAGGLGYSFLKGNQTDPNQQALQNEAPNLLAQGGALTASGQQLQTYLTNGTLPPALQSQVTSAVNAEKARIIQNHASNGENTNPAQNSALAAELAQADINGINLAGQQEQQLFQAGTQLLQTGVNETGLSTQLYETLAKMDEANTTQLMSSIATMAAALGGGTKIQIGGTSTATA